MLNSLPENLFYEFLGLCWNASFHTANSRSFNKEEAEKNEKGFYEHARRMHNIGQTLGLSEKLLEHVKWGPWDAAWLAANTTVVVAAPWALQDKKRFHNHFQQVDDTGELSSRLVHEMKYMASDISWYCAHVIFGQHEQRKHMARLVIDHCMNVCPELDKIKLCKDLGMTELMEEFSKQPPQTNITIEGNLGALQTGPESRIETVIQNNLTTEQKKNLADVAKDIQKLLNRLTDQYPSENDEQKGLIAGKIVAEIKENPKLRTRFIAAVKSAGIEALKEAVNNPIFNISSAFLEGFIET